MIKNSKCVLTDSGGIQEETTILKIPCLTMRENTERPVTIKEGSNALVGRNKNKIMKSVNNILQGKQKKGGIPKCWDGKSAKRVGKTILDNLCEQCVAENLDN